MRSQKSRRVAGDSRSCVRATAATIGPAPPSTKSGEPSGSPPWLRKIRAAQNAKDHPSANTKYASALVCTVSTRSRAATALEYARSGTRAPREVLMSRIARFAAYAAAFEKSFASDDWSLVEPFFTEDAVYEIDLDPPIGGRLEGRAAILAYFKRVLDQFDRRFESRELALLEGPKEEGDSVWIRGSATYRAAGVPAFVLELKEIVTFAGDRIRRLEDEYQPAMKQSLADYLGKYGEKLGIRAD
jgi:hypothetical protein